MLDKTKVIDLCLDYNQAAFIARAEDFRLIDEWVADGCDFENDVLMWFREATSQFKDITSVKWFRKGCYRKRDERRGRESVLERVAVKNAPPDADAEMRKAKMLAKTIRVLGVQRAEHVQWLAAYEEKHGKIVLESPPPNVP